VRRPLLIALTAGAIVAPAVEERLTADDDERITAEGDVRVTAS
jgi:hypothetical protein